MNAQPWVTYLFSEMPRMNFGQFSLWIYLVWGGVHPWMHPRHPVRMN